MVGDVMNDDDFLMIGLQIMVHYSISVCFISPNHHLPVYLCLNPHDFGRHGDGTSILPMKSLPLKSNVADPHDLPLKKTPKHPHSVHIGHVYCVIHSTCCPG